MPRVPVADYQVGVAGGQAVAPLVNVASAGITGRQIAQSTSQIADTVAETAIRHETIKQHLQRLDRDQTLGYLEANATLDVQKAARDAIAGADPTQADKTFRASVVGLRKKWRQEAGDDSIAQQLDSNMAIVARKVSLDVQSDVTRQLVQTASGRLGNTLDVLSRGVGMARSDAEREDITRQADTQIENAVAAGVIRADQAEAQRMKFRAGADELTARRLIQTNPAAAVTALAGDRFANLDPDKRQTLAEYAERSVEAERRQREADVAKAAADEKAATAQENAWAAVDLERGIKDGSKGLTDIANLRAEGRLTPAAADELYTAWDAQQKTAMASAEDAARVAGAMSGNVILDPKSSDDRKAVDTFWRAQAAQLPGDEQQALAETIAAKTGVLPPTLAGQLNGAMRASPDRRAWAADTIMRVERASPSVAEDLPADTVRAARLTGNYLMAGMSPAEAAQRVDDQMRNANEPIRKLRETQMTAGGQKSQLNSAWQWATSRSGLRDEQGFLDRGSQGLGDASAPVRAEFEAAYREAFLAHGDDDAARAEAVSVVKRTWAVTKADGTTRWMRYPPERMYGGGDPAAAKWIGEQLTADVPMPEGSTRQLVSDGITARQVQAGQPPTYRVIVKDARGVLNEVPGMRWAPDHKAHAEKVQQTAISDAYAKRQKEMGQMQQPIPGIP
ncbi:MAG: hypothetical protein IPK75_19920 [Acidobacteria bacterium]|nr:hypothetical protein [Acidobacteriota bacterium]